MSKHGIVKSLVFLLVSGCIEKDGLKGETNGVIWENVKRKREREQWIVLIYVQVLGVCEESREGEGMKRGGEVQSQHWARFS